MKLTEMLKTFDMSRIADFNHYLSNTYKLSDCIVYTQSVPYKGDLNVVFKFNIRAEADILQKEREARMVAKGITRIDPRPLVKPKYTIIVNNVENYDIDDMWVNIKTQIDNDIQPYLI